MTCTGLFVLSKPGHPPLNPNCPRKGSGSAVERVSVRIGGRTGGKNYSAARVLAYALANPEAHTWAGMGPHEVHHADGDTLNNRVGNLAILTPEEHRVAHARGA